MKVWKQWIGVAASVAALALPAPGAAQQRLELPEGSAWTHPHAGVAFPAVLDGRVRSGASAFANDFLDVAASYRTDDAGEEISLFVFRNTNGSGAVWLAQARAQIEARDIYANPTLTFPVEPVAIGDHAAAGALAVYAAGEGSDYTSTAVALFEMGGWYAKLRGSSKSLDPADLREAMLAAVSAIGWPEDAAFAAAQSPVANCAVALTFKRKSKDVKTDTTDAILQSVFGSLIQKKIAEAQAEKAETKPTGSYCLDSVLTPTQRVYRFNAASDAYLIAPGDSGRAILVGRSAAADLKSQLDERKSSKERYEVQLVLPDQRIYYRLQDRLPSPTRAIELVEAQATTSTVTTWGDDTNVNLDAGVVR